MVSAVSLDVQQLNTGVIGSYDILLEKVSNWMNRSDIADHIPDFVRLAENEVNRRLAARPVRPMMARVSSTLNSEFLSVPSDLINVVSFEIASGGINSELQRIDPSNVSLMASRGFDGPRFYTILNGEFRIIPAPTGVYDVALCYWAKLPDLFSNATNWMLEQHPDVYLFAALLSGAAFIQDAESMGQWSSMFDRSMGYVWEAYPDRSNKTLLTSDIPMSYHSSRFI